MTKEYILCVDDEKSILMSLRAQIKKHYADNYDYEEAQSAEEALEVIEEIYEDGGSVAVIISDWLMPGVKGDELLVQVHDSYPEIIKIMLTGHVDPEAVKRAETGANLAAYFTKPWALSEIVDVIDQEKAKQLFDATPDQG